MPWVKSFIALREGPKAGTWVPTPASPAICHKRYLGPVPAINTGMRTLSIRVLTAVAVIVAALAATVAPAAALSNYTVTTTDDVVGTDGLFSLREAIDAANSDGDHSSITLGAGLTYDLDICETKAPVDNGFGTVVPPDDDDNNLDGDLDHDESYDLTIIGNGSTINQTCLFDRVLHSMNDQTLLTINNTTITNGNQAPESGDNIRSHGSLTLENGTVVSDGTAWDFGASVHVGDGTDIPTLEFTISDSSVSGNNESGVRLDTGTLITDNAAITDNADSGVVLSFADLEMSDSTVEDNSGAGINGFDATVTISGSTIADNALGVVTSGNFPGVSPIAIFDSTVDSNETGGVSCSYCDSVLIDGSSVTNNGDINGAIGDFGGVSIFTFEASSGLTIVDSTLSGNRSPNDGGAVRARFVEEGPVAAVLPEVLISNSDFHNNRSGILSNGGAVYVERGSVIVSDGSSFTDNWAKPSEKLFGGDGGAIWVEEGPELSISDSDLSSNRAQYDGGAIHTRQVDEVSIDGTLLADNEAIGNSGGGAYIHSATDIEITDSNVLDNLSELGGAGLRISAFDDLRYQVDIDGSTIARNRTDSRLSGGGGVFADGDGLTLEMVNSTVVENEASGAGAGVAVLGDGDVELSHVTMAANDSTGGNAANLYYQNGDLTSFGTFIGIGVGGPDCGTFSGSTSSLGYNRSGDGSCGFVHATDDTGVVGAVIGPLADNGGPTLTSKPGKWSPLVNVIPVADCSQAVDQRDVARPVGARCDVGAVEVAGHGAGPGGFVPTPPRPTPPDGIAVRPPNPGG